MRQTLIALMLLAGCASEPSETSSETGEVGTDSAGTFPTDSTRETDSETDTATEPTSEDTDSETVTYDYEMIQDLSDVDDFLSEMVEQDGVLYFTFAGRFVLCRVDVNGEQEYQCMGESVRSLTSYNGHLWWYSLGNAANYVLETEVITYLSLGEYSGLSLDFTLDDDGLFFADHGCKNVLGMDYDGAITLFENLEYDGRASYLPYVATGSGYVYCSGSAGASFTAGKLYGVSKTGGDIVEITSAPTTNETNLQHTTGPMKIVDDTLYFFHFYTGGSNTEPLRLLSAPAEGGESTILFDSGYGAYASPLVYDESQRVFYFTFTYSRLLYKYDTDGDEIKTVPIEYDPQGQVAVDDTYIYWYMNKSIYRMKKF